MLYLATSCLPAADSASALSALHRLGVARAWVSPGRAPGDRWEPEAARFAERLLLHHACLEAPGQPYWNLAAADEDLRKRAIAGATETMRRAAAFGSPFYSLHPGYALALTLGPDGRPEGPEQARARALDQLCRSLDRLAGLADDLGLGLLVENMPGGREALALWTEPAEINRTLERLGAPPLGLLLDVGHLLLSCQARRWEPEPVLEELKGRVRAIALSRNDGRTDGHLLPKEGGIELALARQAGGLSLPVVLEVREQEPEALRWAIELVEATLKVEQGSSSNP